jgi:hypothetical protein
LCCLILQWRKKADEWERAATSKTARLEEYEQLVTRLKQELLKLRAHTNRYGQALLYVCPLSCITIITHSVPCFSCPMLNVSAPSNGQTVSSSSRKRKHEASADDAMLALKDRLVAATAANRVLR